MSIIIGIDHGYYAIKTAHCSFPAGLTSYGEHEPYVGHTGRVTGNHLHLEVRVNGSRTDAMAYFQ